MQVEVYWNLHKKCYSVRHKGKVIAHAPFVTLKDVTWVVQPAGRKRVLRERKKNVHAFAKGTWIYGDEELQNLPDTQRLTRRIEVTYNPYHNHTFVSRSAPDMPVLWSNFAKLCSKFNATSNATTPAAYVYNLIEPLQRDADCERYDQGPRTST